MLLPINNQQALKFQFGVRPSFVRHCCHQFCKPTKTYTSIFTFLINSYYIYNKLFLCLAENVANQFLRTAFWKIANVIVVIDSRTESKVRAGLAGTDGNRSYTLNQIWLCHHSPLVTGVSLNLCLHSTPSLDSWLIHSLCVCWWRSMRSWFYISVLRTHVGRGKK